MPYLVCDKCGGFYKLKGGESLDNLTGCPCGGTLNYYDTFGDKSEDNDKEELYEEIKDLKEEVKKIRKESEKEKPSDTLSSIILGIIALFFIIPLIFLVIISGIAVISSFITLIYQNPLFIVAFLVIFGTLTYYNYNKNKEIKIKNSLLLSVVMTFLFAIIYFILR